MIILIFLKISPAWFAFISSFGEWKAQKHLLLIEKLLLKIINNELFKSIINLPPRHGKSELISKYFPAFILSNYPQKRIMLASYQSSFASLWGSEVKQILESFSKFLFKIEISTNYKAKGNFKIKNHKGGMYCVGAGGSITGRGADFLIIDDPVKNDKDAFSLKLRENLIRWFQSTAFTRLEPDGSIILMMTRWHEEDLAGYLINNFTIQLKNEIINNFDINKWLWLNLPAFAEQNDPLGREIDEPLWTNRFSKDKLLEIKQQIGDYWFEALYQQRPAPSNGNIFKREHFRYYTSQEFVYTLMLNEGYKKQISKDYINIYATMDIATSLSQMADFTVILVFGLTPDRDILILDVIRERFEASSHLGLIENIYRKWEPKTIGIEKVQYQISLIEAARAKGLPVVSLIPDRDKLQRALPMVHQIKEGKVFFLKSANWLSEFERELLNFPKSVHDDQVDAFAYISQLIMPISNILPVGKKRQSINNS